MSLIKKNLLLVEDDADVLEVMTEYLAARPDLRILKATNGAEALEIVRNQAVGAVISDVDMPVMNGIDLLSEVRSLGKDTPFVFLSAHANKNNVLSALRLGAVDFIEKPFRRQAFLELVDNLLTLSAGGLSAPPVVKSGPVISNLDMSTLVVIGASTGGTEALRKVLKALPSNIPPIVVVQHIPAGFSRALATSLDDLCPFTVKEAENGDAIVPGQVLIAPGGFHLALELAGAPGRLKVKLSGGEPENNNKPSVDVLFNSVAELVGKRAIGIILTGMGNDGAKGLLKMKQAGARTIAQDEATCVVFGMPKEAIALKAVDAVLPLDRIAVAILALLQQQKAA